MLKRPVDQEKERPAAQAQGGKSCPLPIDRRTAERLPLAIPVTYAMILPGELFRGTTTTTNLSGWGVQFTLPKMIGAQTACQIGITLPGQQEPLALVGRVVWCRRSGEKHGGSYEVGINFIVQDPYGDKMFSRYSQFIASQLLARYLR